jgi:hypothetical protein
MEIDALHRLAEAIAPELSGLRLVLRDSSWPWPPDAGAVATDSPPEWTGLPDGTPTIIFADAEHAAASLLCHELAHLLPFVPRIPTGTFRVESETTRVAWSTNETIHVPPWLGHGSDFIRRALHLCHRADRLGLDVDIFRAFDGPRYGLSDAWQYQFRLGVEPESMIRATFAEIEAVEPPAGFTKLFNDDTRGLI